MRLQTTVQCPVASLELILDYPIYSYYVFLIISRWAWQNPHITQHIPAESRLQRASSKKKNGQPKRPRHGVTSLLSNLHLLLRVPSFSRWPLEISFFSEDVHKAWLEWTQAVAEPLRSSVSVIEDFQPNSIARNEHADLPQAKKRKIDHGMDALDIGYASHKAYVEKGKEVVGFEREGSCAVCKGELEHDAGVYAICPNTGCESVTHLTCLGKHFVEDADSVVPIKGDCPSCNAELRWVDVVKEVTLRLRGQKEVEKLLKVKRTKKGGTASQAAIDVFDDDLSEEDIQRDIEEELDMLQKFDPSGRKADNDDIWHDIDDSDDSDDSDIHSITSIARMTEKAKAVSKASKAGPLRTVVEDSDWEDALVVD